MAYSSYTPPPTGLYANSSTSCHRLPATAPHQNAMNNAWPYPVPGANATDPAVGAPHQSTGTPTATTTTTTTANGTPLPTNPVGAAAAAAAVPTGVPANGTADVSTAPTAGSSPEIRITPLSAMTGAEGSPFSVRVTLPTTLLDPHPPPPGAQDNQLSFIFGNFLIGTHRVYEPHPPAPGLTSVVLHTQVPAINALSGTDPNHVQVCVHFRPTGPQQQQRGPSVHPVGTYRILPGHARKDPHADLWTIGNQPVQSQYDGGAMRNGGAGRTWDPSYPYLRPRYQGHSTSPTVPRAAGNPPPRGSPGIMGNGLPIPPPMNAPHASRAPPLVRAPLSNHSHDGSYHADPSRPRATLQLQGDLGSMAYGWTVDELSEGRRLVQFWRKQEGTTIHATFRPIMIDQYVKNSIVVSCIFRADRNECYITSVDVILLLEALVASRFSIEEKNRIRRNLEGFHPETVRKHSGGGEEFFKRIMNFKDPKPRTIAKDVKTFPWKVLEHALMKVVDKYTPDTMPELGNSAHQGSVPLLPVGQHFLPPVQPSAVPSQPAAPTALP